MKKFEEITVVRTMKHPVRTRNPRNELIHVQKGKENKNNNTPDKGRVGQEDTEKLIDYRYTVFLELMFYKGHSSTRELTRVKIETGMLL